VDLVPAITKTTVTSHSELIAEFLLDSAYAGAIFRGYEFAS